MITRNADAGDSLQPELTLHSYRRCPFAIRVRMTLEEKGLRYMVIEENLSELSPELLRHHPEGKVPVLLCKTDAGTQVIYESSIITAFLDELAPTPPLLPRTPAARAEARLWTYWCDHALKPDLDAYKYDWDSTSAEGRIDMIQNLDRHLRKLEASLSPSPYLLGGELTLADLHVFPFYRQLIRARPPAFDLGEFSGVVAWYGRMSERPAFLRAMEKR